jgi:hypothetical protein
VLFFSRQFTLSVIQRYLVLGGVHALDPGLLCGTKAGMETNWAAENLQLIRTLMERTALYRRALAPIMILAGVLGVAGAVVGVWFKQSSPVQFVQLWAAVALLAVAGALFLVRRQALKASEPFWSPPTRRVGQALLPALFGGGVAGGLPLVCAGWDFLPIAALPALWMLLYGAALSAAGFFMQRGIKLLGWIFVFSGCVNLAFPCLSTGGSSLLQAHWWMGIIFGGLHLAYGVYLYFTERNEA